MRLNYRDDDWLRFFKSLMSGINAIGYRAVARGRKTFLNNILHNTMKNIVMLQSRDKLFVV